MRYTRYNYKAPKKSNKFIIVIILTLIVAIALGTIFSNLLPRSSNATKGSDAKTTNAVVSQSNIKDYVALQCGAFSKMEKALALKNSLMAIGTPFIIEEDNLIRVFFGIYPKEDIDTVTKQLTTSKIVYTKINYQLIGKNLTSAQTNEMISADIKILNTLSEKNTKTYETVKLKEWLVSLKGSDAKSVSYSKMTEIKKYLTAMPAVLKKEKAEEEYIYIYKFIKNLLKV